MDPGPAGVDGAGPRTPRARGPRRLLVAGTAAVVVLLAVIAVLAIRLASTPPAAKAATPRPAPTPTGLTVPAIYQRLAPSVVLVRSGHELGTGVIVADDGTILTANHVIASGGGAITVTFADGTTANAIVAAADPKRDIATLTPAKLPQVVVPATVGGGAGVGAPVVAIGNPLGLIDSVSSGVISGLDRTADTSNGKFSGLIQFDASVNPGSSGGPLLDAHGLVIGIVVSIAAPTGEDAFAGIGFAVPIGAALGGGSGTGPGKGPQI